MVRAAISEITEYSRAQISALPDVTVIGPAADDVSHILAELLDNATSKSPESAAVVVRAERTGDGTMVVSVEDTGIGIPADQLADINMRLGRAPVLEAAATRHMGLYVVGRLAQRHGIRVQLRERPYGGITAHVIMPNRLVRGQAAGPSHNGRTDQPRSLGKLSPAPSARLAPPVTPRFFPADPSGLPRRTPRQPAATNGTTAPDAGPGTPAPSALAAEPGDTRASQIRDDLSGFRLGQRAARGTSVPELHHAGGTPDPGAETSGESALAPGQAPASGQAGGAARDTDGAAEHSDERAGPDDGGASGTDGGAGAETGRA